jgi:3'(2'),5'-bisphosphate nucleotidase
MHAPPLDALAELAREAGREIMEIWRRGVAAQEKLDGSPVTIADQRAEALIEAGLARLCPGAPMIGEEATAEGRVPARGQAWFLVDPLDGTKEFISTEGSGEFTVNIAWIEAGEPRLGVVYAPKSGWLFGGGPDGAWRQRCDPDSAQPCAAREPLRVSARGAEALRCVASRRSAGEETEAFITRCGAVERRAVSSSLKFCIIAEGEADIYPRLNPTNEWDLAAGHAVLAAAGGGVIRHDGSPLRYRAEGAEFLVPRFIAYGGAAAEQAARAAALAE